MNYQSQQSGKLALTKLYEIISHVLFLQILCFFERLGALQKHCSMPCISDSIGHVIITTKEHFQLRVWDFLITGAATIQVQNCLRTLTPLSVKRYFDEDLRNSYIVSMHCDV